MQRTARQLTIATAAVIAAGAVGGCGWTVRDEFYRNRQVVIHAEPGDGSRVTFVESSAAWPSTGADASPELVLVEPGEAAAAPGEP